MINFAKRNFKEIVRDPLSIIFAILLPLFLLFIFQQFKIPNQAYEISNFTPGIIIFSFSFVTLFTSTLVAKDRSTSLLARLCASPMESKDFIVGYTLSILPFVLIQNIIFYGCALLLKLPLSINILYAILLSLPLSLLFINLGIIIGSITTDKASSGVSSVVVQLVAFTSGMYFDTSITGDFFNTICKILPFSKCLDVLKYVLNGTGENILKSFIILLIYVIITMVLSIVLFNKKLESDK